MGSFKIGAQTPDFTVPPSLCLNQTVTLTNLSTGSTSYLWDFCHDGLNNPTGDVLTFTADPSGIPEGIEMINDNGQWYGFYFERNINALNRLDFGTDINNPAPNLVTLGNLGFLFDFPTHIRIVNENSRWYGIVVNFGNSHLTNLDFGSSLSVGTAGIVATDMGTFSGLTSPRGLDVVDSPSGYVAIVSSWVSGSNLLIAQFSNGLNNAPTNTRIISTTIAKGLGISLISNNGSWFGLVAGNGDGNIVHFSFGPDLFDTSYTPVQTIIASLIQPTDLKIVQDGLDFYALIESSIGLTRINFGSSMILSGSQTVTAIGNFNGSISDPLGLSVVRNGANWKAFALGQTSGQLNEVNFQDVCSNAGNFFNTLTAGNPTAIFYYEPGSYEIDLIAFNASGGFALFSQSVLVQNIQALSLVIDNDNACVGHTNHFRASSSDGSFIGNGAWDFGGGNTGSGNAASFQFSAVGRFPVQFSATEANGCANLVVDTVSIFNPPQSNFTLPTTSPICSNQNYTFTNTSTFDAGSNPTWQWSVNGTKVSTSQNLNYLLSSTNAQTITLTDSIPGCSTQSTQTIATIQPGPLVSFTGPATGCVNGPDSFVNTTSGSVTTYLWTFGDGNSSTQTNASNAYANTGIFPVTLMASNTVGCQNSFSQNIAIYSNPQPAFSIELPPFSCANSPAQFDNNTPPLTDSNIATWLWTFGDGANATSNGKNPAYTYATASTYNVTLQATTNFGCTNTVQNSVTILPSPVAAFTNNPACVGQDTQFTNNSTGTITNYQWNVKGTLLTGVTPPPYIFKAAGAYPVTLTVSGSNGCNSQLTKTVAVPIPPVVDFSFQQPCAEEPTIFQELNPGGSDPTVTWNWNFGTGQGSGTGSPVTNIFTSAGGYSITLSTTRQSGCVYSLSKNVSIYDSPQAGFTPSVQAGAAPLNVNFTNTSSIADSSFWQFGDPGKTTSKLLSPSFTYTELGEYKVLLTVVNYNGVYSCMDTVSAEISVVIPHIDLTMKNFALTPDPASNSSKAVVTISNIGNIPFVNPEVDLDLGGGTLLRGALNGVVNPGQSVMQTLGFEIVPQSIRYICADVVVVGDQDVSNDKQCLTLAGEDVVFTPYPNPVADNLNFDWVSSTAEDVTVTVYQANGQPAFEQTFQNLPAGLGQLSIATASLANGLYLIRFSGSKVKQTFRVVVAH